MVLLCGLGSKNLDKFAEKFLKFKEITKNKKRRNLRLYIKGNVTKVTDFW